ncbi:MAG TPA: hypothetical protein VNG69_12875, partial [Casimicrobiaceae bacterium]|nr:hypothetical protein [Casimicrobiaceae bacterium]
MRSTIVIILAALGSAVSASSSSASEWSDVRALQNAAAQPAIAKHISAEQRRMLSDKLAIIDRHMQSAITSREITTEHRLWLLESMYKLSLADLRQFDAPTGYESVVRAITKAAKAPRKLGSTSSELVYYPLTPCRYVDTRNVGGPLLDNVARAFDLANTGNVYGGSLSCDPKSTVGNNEDLIGALSINVAIVSPTAAPGVIGSRKPGTAGSTALVNWYNVGPIVQ